MEKEITMTKTIATVSVPFHVAAVGEEEAQAAAEVIRSGWLTMGPRTFEFERQFGAYVGAKHAIAVCSCTAALHLALEALGVGPGDEVLLPTTTFTATAEVVCYLGAKPVLVDVQADSMNLDPNDAARRITPKTKAIIPVHLAGAPCDMDAILGLAKRHGMTVIEDAAHALPATFQGRRIGSLSKFTAFSFYATKTLTTGEGGMITTDDDRLADRMRIMRLHGIERDAWKRYSSDGSWYYQVIEAGFKYNMTDIAAALGLVQLQKCDAMQKARKAIAEKYSQAFQGRTGLFCPSHADDRESAWHLYILRIDPERLKLDRNGFITELKQRNIGTSVHFIPLHLQPFYQKTFGYRAGDLPQAERQFERCLSLPIWPGMAEPEVNSVIEAVTELATLNLRE